MTNLAWKAPREKGESQDDAQRRIGLLIKEKEGINAPDKNCFGCHR